MLIAHNSALAEQPIDLNEEIRDSELQFLVALDRFAEVVENNTTGRILDSYLKARKRLRDMYLAREQQLLLQHSPLRDPVRQQHLRSLRTLDQLALNLDLEVPDSGKCVLGYLRTL